MCSLGLQQPVLLARRTEDNEAPITGIGESIFPSVSNHQNESCPETFADVLDVQFITFAG
jgi:hypothetical protein